MVGVKDIPRGETDTAFLVLCSHDNLVWWVQCGECGGLYHCLCVDVLTSKARLTIFNFIIMLFF